MCFQLRDFLTPLCHQVWAERGGRFPQITVPTLFLSGLKDEIVPPSHMKAAVQNSKDESIGLERISKGKRIMTPAPQLGILIALEISSESMLIDLWVSMLYENRNTGLRTFARFGIRNRCSKILDIVHLDQLLYRGSCPWHFLPSDTESSANVNVGRTRQWYLLSAVLSLPRSIQHTLSL